MSDLFPSFSDEQEESLEGFTGGFEVQELPEDVTYITVRTTSGETRYVPTSEAMPVSEILIATNLYIGGRVEYLFNNVAVNGDAVIPVGGTLTIVGAVKGG